MMAGLALGLTCGSIANAQSSSDSLIDKLVQKGILTTDEATQLRADSTKDFSKAYTAKAPDWLQSLKLNGDFRGRYDGIFGDDGPGNPQPVNRDRLRYRIRFGVTSTLSDNFEVGLRLGSGDLNTTLAGMGGSPLSGNTTMNNDASRKFIFVDLAYARWTPATWAEVQFGKMQNLFWTTGVVFDPDYNPEGAQERFTYALTENQTFGFTSGQWVIAENKATADAYLMVKWSKKFSTKAGLGIYTFTDQKAIPLALETAIADYQNGTPTVGVGAQTFNPIFTRAEATYALDSFPAYTGPCPVTLGAEYVNNPAANGAAFVGKNYAGADNVAYDLGVSLGSSKTKGNWQLSYDYKSIDTAAVWRGLTDDDFGFGGKGGTDVRGHQIGASYRVLKPLTLGVRYFKTEQINNKPTKLNEQDRVFVDLLWNF